MRGQEQNCGMFGGARGREEVKCREGQELGQSPIDFRLNFLHENAAKRCSPTCSPSTPYTSPHRRPVPALLLHRLGTTLN